MKIRFFSLLLVISVFAGKLFAGPLDLVPLPASIQKGEGEFEFSPQTAFFGEPGLTSLMEYGGRMVASNWVCSRHCSRRGDSRQCDDPFTAQRTI